MPEQLVFQQVFTAWYFASFAQAAAGMLVVRQSLKQVASSWQALITSQHLSPRQVSHLRLLVLRPVSQIVPPQLSAHLVVRQAFAVARAAFMSQPASVAPVMQSRQVGLPMSATQALYSSQHCWPRQSPQAGLLMIWRPVSQMTPVEHSMLQAPVPPWGPVMHSMSAWASGTPSGAWFWMQSVWQVSSEQPARQSKSAPQGLPVSHSASSAQQLCSAQSWHSSVSLNWKLPQPIVPPEPVVDPVVLLVEVVPDEVVMVPPVPVVVSPPEPVVPVVLLLLPLLPHATIAITEPTAADHAQIFML